MFIMICCYGLNFAGKANALQNEASGIVNVNLINLRPQPNLDKPPIKILRRGEKLVIHEFLDGWIRVSAGDQSGYVRHRDQYIRIIQNAPKGDQTTDRDETEISRFKKEAEDINRRLEKSQQEVESYSRKEIDAISQLNGIDLSINEAVQRISVLKSDRETLSIKIKATASAIPEVQARIEDTEKYASRRLVALYKLSRLGRIHVLASADSVYDLLQRKAAIERVLKRDEQVWEKLKRDNLRLNDLFEALSEQRDQKQSIETSIEKQIQVKYRVREKRKKLLEDIRNKKTLALSAIGSLKRAARDLDQTIRSLSTIKPPTKPISPPEARAKPQDVEKDDLYLKPFGELKGLLNMPVNGKIITRFGRYIDAEFNVVNFRSGIDIQADRGEPIHAVCGGHVQYASWFKGYGNMIIIDHGDSYYTVYAHAEELFKSKGDVVEVEEVIATVGDSGSMIGPALHFELRYHGKPLDPLKWMKKG